MLRAFFRSFAVLAPIGLVMTACAVETEPTIGAESDELNTKICPKIAIYCADGYVPKMTGGCNWNCVPDRNAAKECGRDSDCPQIYCITTPCPQLVCRGHKCVQDSGPQGGEKCGNASCGAGSYCCNALCSMCAPDGMFCIQGCAEAL